MTTVLQQYVNVFQTAQQRWMDAQAECWRELLKCGDEGAPFCQQQLTQRLENSLQSGASLLQLSADMHHDLQVLGERWLGQQQRSWLQYLSATPRAVAPCLMSLDAGLSSCLIASRVSRQIHHFASTRLSSAPVHAMRGAQRVYRHTGK